MLSIMVLVVDDRSGRTLRRSPTQASLGKAVWIRSAKKLSYSYDRTLKHSFLSSVHIITWYSVQFMPELNQLDLSS